MGDAHPRDVFDAARILNEALALDPDAISDLFRYRVPFTSQELADHPNIQVGYAPGSSPDDEHPVYDIGVLGLLNGIFGSETNRIVAMAAGKPGDHNFTGCIERFFGVTDYPKWMERWKQEHVDKATAEEKEGDGAS